MSEEVSDQSAFVERLYAVEAGRNLGFGLVVGAVLTAGVYYAYVYSPDELAQSELYYISMGVLAGLVVAISLAVVLSLVRYVRLD